MTVDIHLYVDPRLKELAGRAADEHDIPLSEFITRILANELKRPDLGVIPRGKPGRPRTKLMVDVS